MSKSDKDSLSSANQRQAIVASMVPESYLKAPRHLMAVDCIIFGVDGDQLKLLVFKREIDPFQGQWSLLGSWVQEGEAISAAASRVLHELTGLSDLYMEQLHAFGEIDRDDGGRVVSIAYWSVIKIDSSRQSFDVVNHEATWVSLDDVPPLIMDHSQMVEMAITRLRERVKFYPIGFELVPEEFTLLQLFDVYKAIYGRPIDERNFRKKIQKSGLVVQLDKKDKTTSRKGSFLYRFDEDKYQQLLQEGYDFAF